ncbi:MAG: hypothetical protein DDT26_01973 [Dehalococcoidia bacterium]|nr:hypothetical protein [Chloroflexota bacterium]MBT9166202.1 hypothetical protein [Chloroflexota bacterium]
MTPTPETITVVADQLLATLKEFNDEPVNWADIHCRDLEIEGKLCVLWVSEAATFPEYIFEVILEYFGKKYSSQSRN